MSNNNGLPSTLEWTNRGSQEKQRVYSNLGHAITGVRNSAGSVLYNAWAGEPHFSRHLEQGFDGAGLARCKAACERYANSNVPQQEIQR